jgi:ribosomal protein S18 acetylase RimI-like enzyme
MKPEEIQLAWRLERAFWKAWPALEEAARGDWLLRFSAGVQRRGNSANPTRADVRDIEASIAACEALYRERGMPAIFRLPSIVEPTAERRLDRLGYRAEGESLTLFADLADAAAEPDAKVALPSRPDAEWLAAMIALQGHEGERAAAYRRIVESVAVPAAFAGFRAEGELAALAYGAVDDGLLCFESVITDIRYRGRGYARRMLAALIAWGADAGAKAVCLQVDAANAPGQALYASLGLKKTLYRYHYRREPAAG